ncbi:hypothetical protein MHPYR_170032 [uncultured Mycobacterium sp.]|uniref:Uncharacterized protein n=1 Tax=uncultured Mycobacterium sp. TaxID=171292 RepID=A0A1Y5PC27_9MYCO|nr:hypothetical protein MHPYR_170032 [uncultured Mycobacterium sp.]
MQRPISARRGATRTRASEYDSNLTNLINATGHICITFWPSTSDRESGGVKLLRPAKSIMGLRFDNAIRRIHPCRPVLLGHHRSSCAGCGRCSAM